ncbi:MAG: peptidylprolyl isomerase [Lactobacillus sp.]|jgi:peptidyl-prolyl cis-trans isomerase B (cyclophilin B)|nr:peptidylprolyl isomerase [Lactobacillus sp.]MCH3906312.1 peptidylprolyl isomerase [Lactobacillus sp.]MCH3990114.1 peptidylprolyl isomerase [Lactobacillus sp.]MCH4069172.1 peptidylprolyl isomerase [Lactobacillus sp.]MCI1303474.1 peptidylprolyl isomerase [Lactobacillus sp.]
MNNSQNDFPQLSLTNVEGPQALVKTNYGDFLIQLFEKEAPMLVENFVRLAQSRYYDGTVFYKIDPDFALQGGSTKLDGTGGKSAWGHPIENEFAPNLFHFRGAVSMVSEQPQTNTNSSQFFVVQNKHTPEQYLKQLEEAGYPEDVINTYKQNGGLPILDQRYSIFGQVVQGLDVVDKIAGVEIDKDNHPVKPVKIETVEITGDLWDIKVPRKDKKEED